MTLDKLLKDAQVVAVICNQWGDTGKGKFSDYFAAHWADVTARGTGGNNAGHTVVVNGKEKVYHLIPAGIANDAEGKPTILGNGMVLDLKVLSEELDDVEKEGGTYNHLMISKDAFVIMPRHIHRDKTKTQSQSKGGIGSTGRGIGPSYTDKVARFGVRVSDLLDRDNLISQIRRTAEFNAQDIGQKEIDRTISQLQPYIDRIKPFVRDTVSEMHDFFRQGKKILLEGAQGLLLSIEHGTYPYVTSSDCSLNGTATGVGLSAKMVDLPFGIVKFPFMTRVGAGPFPTELGDDSEKYCASGLEHDIFYEVKEYLGMDLHITGIRQAQAENDQVKLAMVEKEVSKYIKSHQEDVLNLMNSDDPFVKGVGMRLAAGEYGATTKRPRRTGWTDAVAARYAVGINGPLMILTKADCISGADEFKICYGYKDNGKLCSSFSKDKDFLYKVRPEFKTYEGYGGISDIKDPKNLPASLKESILDFEAFTGGRVAAVSVGADREETIIM